MVLQGLLEKKTKQFKFFLRFLGELIYLHFPGVLLYRSSLPPNSARTPSHKPLPKRYCQGENGSFQVATTVLFSNWKSCGAVWQGHGQTRFNIWQFCSCYSSFWDPGTSLCGQSLDTDDSSWRALLLQCQRDVPPTELQRHHSNICNDNSWDIS